MSNRVSKAQAQLFYDTARKVSGLGGRVDMSFLASAGRDIHTLRCNPRGGVTVSAIMERSIDVCVEQYRDLRDFAVVYGLQQG